MFNALLTKDMKTRLCPVCLGMKKVKRKTKSGQVRELPCPACTEGKGFATK